MAMPSRDITGLRFGQLVAIASTGEIKNGSRVWRFLCDCGVEVERVSGNVKSGHIRSCGCLKTGVPARHGRSNSPIHGRWVNMRRRCEDPKNENYSTYGGRGIKVCDRWHTFENFLADMGDLPFKGAQIDRIDNDGDYEPLNCRWATSVENCNNKSNNVRLKINGREKSLQEWSIESGVSYATIWARLKRNWTAERAVFEQVRM